MGALLCVGFLYAASPIARFLINRSYDIPFGIRRPLDTQGPHLGNMKPRYGFQVNF